MQRRVVATGLIAAAVVLALATGPALASSHREAPGIAGMPKVDGTDFYMFNSYEAGRSGYVTFIANYNGLQDAYGAPNYFLLDPDAVYRIHIDNVGDAVEHITFQFKVNQQLKDIQLPIGGQNVSIPLVQAGQITAGPGGAAALNVEESYTLTVIRGALDDPAHIVQSVTDSATGSRRFGKPFDNIGNKTMPNYAAYANQFVRTINIPGCTSTGRVFVGQRHDGFAVNLGEIFDLVNLSNPLGPRDVNPNTLEDKNVTTFALEVPASCLTAGGGTTIGAWTTSALPRNRVLSNTPGFKTDGESGDFVQVSRLGSPLVNEVVIGLKDKNKFNGSRPKDDAQFATYVTNPTLPALVELLFGAAGVKAPTNFPRKDLVAPFLTGITGLNALGGPSEMLRLNTAIPAVPAVSQNNLGVLGGDNAGFPNGRRPGDDVVDIALRVEMGVLCHIPSLGLCQASDAPSGNLPFTDGTLNDVSQFDATFPYLKTPIPGSPNGVNGEGPDGH